MFRVQYEQLKTYENLKRFFKILSTGNVLFEQMRKIKIVILKDEVLKRRISQIKSMLSENLRKSQDLGNPNTGKLSQEKFESLNIQEDALTYFKCKQLVKKIYRQLCTQRLIDNFYTKIIEDRRFKQTIEPTHHPVSSSDNDDDHNNNKMSLY